MCIHRCLFIALAFNEEDLQLPRTVQNKGPYEYPYRKYTQPDSSFHRCSNHNVVGWPDPAFPLGPKISNLPARPILSFDSDRAGDGVRKLRSAEGFVREFEWVDRG